MNTENGQVSPASHETQLPLNGGLFFTGMVIATKTEEKEWEQQKYTQTTVGISDGERTYNLRHRHNGTPFNPPKLFQPCKVRVVSAATDKGQISLRGDFV